MACGPRAGYCSFTSVSEGRNNLRFTILAPYMYMMYETAQRAGWLPAKSLLLNFSDQAGKVINGPQALPPARPDPAVVLRFASAGLPDGPGSVLPAQSRHRSPFLPDSPIRGANPDCAEQDSLGHG